MLLRESGGHSRCGETYLPIVRNLGRAFYISTLDEACTAIWEHVGVTYLIR